MVSRHFEEIIDEKCRMLNKSGTSRGSALHLAQWMKGQLDESVSSHIKINLKKDVLITKLFIFR